MNDWEKALLKFKDYHNKTMSSNITLDDEMKLEQRKIQQAQWDEAIQTVREKRTNKHTDLEPEEGQTFAEMYSSKTMENEFEEEKEFEESSDAIESIKEYLQIHNCYDPKLSILENVQLYFKMD